MPGTWFYPLHITVLSLTEEARRGHIISGSTICPYSPILSTFEKSFQIQSSRKPHSQTSKTRVSARLATYQTIRESAYFRLRNDADVSFREFSCTVIDIKAVFFHVMLTFYVVDTTECEEVLFIKRVTKAYLSCNTSLIQNSILQVANLLVEEAWCRSRLYSQRFGLVSASQHRISV